MTDTDEPQYRQHYQPDPDEVSLRQLEERDEDGLIAVRMPIASTGEVRNDGDDPLTRDELNGMARQVEERQIGAFPAHGRDNTLAAGRYSPFEKLGYWDAAEIESRDDGGEELLYADALMPDPETLPAATGSFREGLAVLKEQAERGIALSASIGWRDDESMPGGVDLMEASIVGIPADPRTDSQQAVEVARAAVDAGADPDRFLDEVRAVVMGPSNTNESPAAERHLSDQQAEMARQLVSAYRDAQGDGSVENFEGWLFNVAWHEFDDDQFHAARTALQEWFRETSPLDEPVSSRFVPFLEEQGDDGEGDTESTNDMTDTDTEPDDESGTETDEEPEQRDAPEWATRMLELQEQTNEQLQELADAVREDDDGDDDDDDDDEDDEQSADDPDGEQTTEEPGDEQAAEEIDELRSHVEALREGGIDVSDVDVPDSDAADGEPDAGEERDTSTDTEDAPSESPTKSLLR